MKPTKIKYVTLWTLAAILFTTFCLLTAPGAMAADKVYKARLSYHWGAKHFSAIMASKFAEECNKAAGGRLKIEVFPQGQLYSIAQIVPALSQGQVDLGGVLGVLLMRVDKNFFLNGMQRFFKSFKQKRDFWTKNKVGRKYWDKVQKKLGIKVLCYIPVGPTCYFSSAHALDTLESFKGLKARTLIGTERYTFKAMGVNFVKVSTAEVYSALKSGMINTFNTVPSALKAYSWWDFAKYAQQPYTFHADAFVAVNLKWWNRLPQDLRDLMEKKVGPKITDQATAGVMNYSDQILKEFAAKYGGKVSTWSQKEISKAQEMDKTKVWPEIAKNIDPELYQAAKDWVGIK
jgi:TRAP-type C4-dicarboxylate transport system substrate-binding protein